MVTQAGTSTVAQCHSTSTLAQRTYICSAWHGPNQLKFCRRHVQAMAILLQKSKCTFIQKSMVTKAGNCTVAQCPCTTTLAQRTYICSAWHGPNQLKLCTGHVQAKAILPQKSKCTFVM